MPKSRVRSELFAGALKAAVKSRLCFFIVLLVISSVMAGLKNYYLALLVPVVFGVVFIKSLLFEMFLIDHMVEASIGYFDWYSKVDDNLYLGALPLQPQDVDRLANQLQIKAIVSVVQRFELETDTFVGRAVSPDQWKELGISQLVLETPDYFPPSFAILDAGAEYLNAQLIQRNKCYCHCKSGKGRSASVVMAYFMRYRGDDVHTAYARMKTARSVVFDVKSSQMKNMIAYAEYLKQPNK